MSPEIDAGVVVNTETKLMSSTALLAAAAAVASGSAPANAEPLKPRAMAMPSWQGFYVGGSLGASWLNSGVDDTLANVIGYGGLAPGALIGSNTNTTSTNFLGTLQAGYNWQTGPQTVFGVEGDISWLGNRGTSSTGLTGANYYGANYTATTTKTSKVSTVATFRGRFGFAINGNTLPYITAGVAVGKIKNTYTAVMPAYGAVSTSTSSWQPGVALGAGVEHRLSGGPWSVRAEVLWIGFKDTSLTPGNLRGSAYNTGTVTFSNQLVQAKIGVNYRF